MSTKDMHGAPKDSVKQSLDYLRRRSQHRLWWNSAQIALRRGKTATPPPAPGSSLGKRT